MYLRKMTPLSRSNNIVPGKFKNFKVLAEKYISKKNKIKTYFFKKGNNSIKL